MESLGKAYSGMKKSGHSMSESECAACKGGMCKYSDGGMRQKYADGDEVENMGKSVGSNVDPEKAKSFNPFGLPKAAADEPPVQKAEGGMIKGVHEGMDDELMDHCASELMDGLETKNKKVILDSIKAIVLSLKG